jgi:hypothetical protein
MSVEYLRIAKFRGDYFLFSGQEKDTPQTITQFAVDACSACQRAFIVIQPIEDVDSLLQSLYAEMNTLATITGHPDEDLSIYVCDQATVFCANCGQEIHLPCSELLDADRTSFGRYALWMTTNHRRIR